MLDFVGDAGHRRTGRSCARRHRCRRPGADRALAAYAADPAREPEVLAALADARLLVPVVAVLGEVEVEPDGLAHDKSSDMAAVLLRGPDGRLALLAFTGLEPMQRWDPEARPVPVPARTAALAALQDGAEALVVDLGRRRCASLAFQLAPPAE